MKQVYLLDTNILLAALIAPQRLPEAVIQTLINPAFTILFSVASIWEIAIKQSLHKPGFDFHPKDIHTLALQTGFEELPVQAAHCQALTGLPWHHRDPFDRLLVAQAVTLPAHLLTADAALTAYSLLVQQVVLL